MPLYRSQAQTGQVQFSMLVILQDQHHLKQSAMAKTTLRLQTINDHFDRHLLVGICIEQGRFTLRH